MLKGKREETHGRGPDGRTLQSSGQEALTLQRSNRTPAVRTWPGKPGHIRLSCFKYSISRESQWAGRHISAGHPVSCEPAATMPALHDGRGDRDT
jgi:hypothetical protein